MQRPLRLPTRTDLDNAVPIDVNRPLLLARHHGTGSRSHMERALVRTVEPSFGAALDAQRSLVRSHNQQRRPVPDDDPTAMPGEHVVRLDH